jgi:hypothetical protein
MIKIIPDFSGTFQVFSKKYLTVYTNNPKNNIRIGKSIPVRCITNDITNKNIKSTVISNNPYNIISLIM